MSRARLYATDAIILRRVDFGEADRILTIMTPQAGKLRVIAKGARKMTSRKAGHVELFTRVRLLLARGRNFDIVSQAETMETYRAIREDLLRSTYGHYLCELVDAFAQEGSEDTALYELLAEGLGWLAEADDPALAGRYFEMRLLALTGYRPQLFKCARTDEVVNIEMPNITSVAFSPTEGGVLSPPAARFARDAFSVPVGALRLLRVLQLKRFEDLRGLEINPAAHAQVEYTMRRYLQYVLERTLRSTHFLRLLESENALAAAQQPSSPQQP